MTPYQRELLNERAAIIAEGEKVDQATAEGMALEQMGFAPEPEPEPKPAVKDYGFAKLFGRA